MTIALRANDGSRYVAKAHSRNARDLYARDIGFLSGDDRGALSYIEWLRGLNVNVAEKPVRDSEYGVLVVDYQTKTMLSYASEAKLTRFSHFYPGSSPFQDQMARAGYVTLSCPANSVDALVLTADHVDNWNRLVQPRGYSFDPHELRQAPFPIWYFVRDPEPIFTYDFGPWTVKEFHKPEGKAEFWWALESVGFTADQKNMPNGLGR
ncbi:hypothetical protein [Rhizobium sp. BK176]|uniref:hypothetical protein n=1 Tax=Rhizobium sp. BK176 TaxID=2587071 RepID=UPI00216A503B|nr:hypothetical protein [Rhizobium sp. BK176]MCS4089296.1 hypothetical protein [Rhizobium sp. BK176]